MSVLCVLRKWIHLCIAHCNVKCLGHINLLLHGQTIVKLITQVGGVEQWCGPDMGHSA